MVKRMGEDVDGVLSVAAIMGVLTMSFNELVSFVVIMVSAVIV